MNEQLIVKNFGPIKDATVDFKKVTVFIGPTGGGKSTLAKLAAIFRNNEFHLAGRDKETEFQLFKDYVIYSFLDKESAISWNNDGNILTVEDKKILVDKETEIKINNKIDEIRTKQPRDLQEIIKEQILYFIKNKDIDGIIERQDSKELQEIFFKTIFSKAVQSLYTHRKPIYFPSERIFASSLEYTWAGLMRDDIGLPKILLDFANKFSLSRKDITELAIPFLNVTYLHIDGRDFIKTPGREELLMLLETASGIQSVTPLLVLLEQLSRTKEKAQSFIIEEPELNLFPLAQFELIKTLIDKCARTDSNNDLILTTHSPYVLTALNLLCYAYRIGQQNESTAKKVAKLIPRKYWIDPEQFAAYYVDTPNTKQKQQVRSIINKKTGLIEENELDNASEELSSIFDKLLRLRQPVKPIARATNESSASK